MAPDLNSVPPSPRPLASSPRPSHSLAASASSSRRPSQSQQLQMGPPAPPASTSTPQSTSTSTSQTQQYASPQSQPTPSASASINILPSNQSAVNQGQTMTTSPGMANTGGLVGDNTGVGTGPGPLRHPRPLTAADLHLQLEKEQEAVVNRLTRELSMLRAAQNASVVSNTSSTSAGLPDTYDHNANHLLSGPSHPAPSQRRHHRSSSATSSRSASALASLSSIPSTTADRTRGGPSTSTAHTGTTAGPQSISLSRQNSSTGRVPGRSGTSSPLPALSNPGSYQALAGENFPSFYTQRPIPHRDVSSSSLAMTTGSTSGGGGGGGGTEMLRADSITSVQTTGRYEEAAYHRHELEAVKRENELLKRRIRELEGTLRRRRESDAADERARFRSESVSTTASLRDGGGSGGTGVAVGAGGVRGRERAKEDDGGEGGESEVQVGESARSAGL
ncbi:hypothetical protein BKA65DRAFT_511109 [Rhexocercosporidium sp. MPI-PUGE-AT-0058]|nr:hypothetical protein BKA65DRAFT_511109 [Rhexocercosporidium sp. MPI-PUGE-AT-0058]